MNIQYNESKKHLYAALNVCLFNTKVKVQKGSCEFHKNTSLSLFLRFLTHSSSSSLAPPFFVSLRLQTILNQVSIQKKKAFVELVLNYWKLKRQSRNGLPLIRRLQTGLQSQKNAQPVCSSVSHPMEAFSLPFTFFCRNLDVCFVLRLVSWLILRMQRVKFKSPSMVIRDECQVPLKRVG